MKEKKITKSGLMPIYLKVSKGYKQVLFLQALRRMKKTAIFKIVKQKTVINVEDFTSYLSNVRNITIL